MLSYPGAELPRIQRLDFQDVKLYYLNSYICQLLKMKAKVFPENGSDGIWGGVR